MPERIPNTFKRSQSAPRGFSLVEIVVVVGMLGVLASIIVPSLIQARRQSLYTICNSNMRQLHQAILMYDAQTYGELENFPERLTHLSYLGYVNDPRVYICPADPTKAEGAYLKPGATGGKDGKGSWRERRGMSSETIGATIDGISAQQNLSYLFEFSGRPLSTYDWDGTTTSPSNWHGTDGFIEMLAAWAVDNFDNDEDEYDLIVYDVSGLYVYEDVWGYNFDDPDKIVYSPPLPHKVDRDFLLDPATGDGTITWWEAKLWQAENGDCFTTGIAGPGERGIPYPDTDLEPDVLIAWENVYFEIFDGTSPRQHGYPRSWIPVLRCFWHIDPKRVDANGPEQVLNLALDGNMFYSCPFWEYTAWKYGRTTWEKEWGME